MNFENALLSREMEAISDKEVRIFEIWDLNHPECPFVSQPDQSVYWRFIDMPRVEYENIKPALKSNLNNENISSIA